MQFAFFTIAPPCLTLGGEPLFAPNAAQVMARVNVRDLLTYAIIKRSICSLAPWAIGIHTDAVGICFALVVELLRARGTFERFDEAFFSTISSFLPYTPDRAIAL